MEEINSNFIHEIIDADLCANPGLKIHTRFPPEPNGYLHIGSVKAICVNTDVANKYNGLFNLRYDDTNPAKESDEFVRAIREDLEWLGAAPTGGVYYGSDYFGKCYEFAVQLIKQGDAYVCDLSKDDLADYKGTDRAQASKESPYRNRSVEEQKDETGYLKPLGDDKFAIHRVFELGEDGYGKQDIPEVQIRRCLAM